MANEQPNLESMLGELLSDPARMAQMQGIISSLGLSGSGPTGEAQAASEPTAGQPSEAAAPGAAVEASAPALPAINLDPSMLASLSGLLPLLSGSGLGGSNGNSGSSGTPKKTKPDHRTALLLALRPYLSDGRREMIDAIVNFNRLGEMLGKGKEG